MDFNAGAFRYLDIWSQAMIKDEMLPASSETQRTAYDRIGRDIVYFPPRDYAPPEILLTSPPCQSWTPRPTWWQRVKARFGFTP